MKLLLISFLTSLSMTTYSQLHEISGQSAIKDRSPLYTKISLLESKNEFDNAKFLEKVMLKPNKKPSKFSRKLFYSIGIGSGQEYFFGFKGSIIKPIPFKKSFTPSKHGFYDSFGYFSIDANAFGLFALWGGIGINGGVSLKFMSIDNSIVFWGALGPNGQKSGQITYNPKMGLHIGPIWFKVGPSFLLSAEHFDPKWMKIGQYYFNFEINYVWRYKGY